MRPRPTWFLLLLLPLPAMAEADSTTAVSAIINSLQRMVKKERPKDSADTVVRSKGPPISERVASLEFSADFYPYANAVFAYNEVAGAGYAVGLLLPFRVPLVDVHYRVRCAFHRITRDPGNLGIRKVYAQARNEILFGKSISATVAGGIDFTPLAGIGFNNGIAVATLDDGRIKGYDTHYFWNYSIGFMAHRFQKIEDEYVHIGFKIEYGRAFVFDEETKQHLSVAVVLGY